MPHAARDSARAAATARAVAVHPDAAVQGAAEHDRVHAQPVQHRQDLGASRPLHGEQEFGQLVIDVAVGWRFAWPRLEETSSAACGRVPSSRLSRKYSPTLPLSARSAQTRSRRGGLDEQHPQVVGDDRSRVAVRSRVRLGEPVRRPHRVVEEQPRLRRGDGQLHLGGGRARQLTRQDRESRTMPAPSSHAPISMPEFPKVSYPPRLSRPPAGPSAAPAPASSSAASSSAAVASRLVPVSWSGTGSVLIRSSRAR